MTPEITREWLEEQLALCAKATAGPWTESTQLDLDKDDSFDKAFILAARTGYPALLQWALAWLRRAECWELDTLIYAQNAAFHEKRERKLKEAIKAVVQQGEGFCWCGANPESPAHMTGCPVYVAKALLEELKEAQP